jgi:hypothetical protein
MADPTGSLQQDIEALFTKRGSRRTEGIAELGARGEALIPAALPLLSDEKKPRREMGWKLLEQTRLSTDAGRESLRQVVRTGLASKREADREAALEVLARQGKELAVAAGDLTHYIATEFDDALRVRAVDVLLGLGLPDAEVLAAVTPLLDSWNAATRVKAAQLIRRRGGEPRPWAWEGVPLDAEVIRELQRLGGTPGAPFDPQAPRPLSKDLAFHSRADGSWRGQDPKGQLEQMPAAVWYFDEHVRWNRSGFHLYDRDFGVQDVLLSGASENFEQQIDGKRRLLYVISYNEDSQTFACIDLLEPGNNPPVWSVDHEGDDGYIRWRSLSDFLKRIYPGRKPE